MPPADADARSGTSTPQGRHRNHGRKRGESRKPQQPESPETPVVSEPDTPDADTEEDSEELFQLLGVNDDDNGDVAAAPVAVEKGLLRLSKENMEAALGNNSAKKKRVRTKNKPRAERINVPADQKEDNVFEGNGTPNRDASPTPNGVARRKRGKGGNKQDASPVRQPSPDALNLAAMSRSLPASFFAEEKNTKANGKADPSKVWDMPSDSPPAGTQTLTWQQQLQASEDTPSKPRSNRSTSDNNRRRLKAASSAPIPASPRAHDRRQSLDNVPVSNLTKMMAVVGPSSAGARPPVSAFDASIPFHTGYNVHRAPQTPVRVGAAARVSPVAAGPPGAISLPIVGDFPRINKSGAPLGGPKYAGPTFHNSPASESLPKPDLDDF